MAVVLMFRGLGWNPMNLKSEGRAETLSSDIRNFDILALIGTQRQAFTDDVITFKHVHHVEYSAGWAKGCHLSYWSCGCSIMVNNQYPPSAVRTIRIPPPHLRGRGLSLRIRDSGCHVSVFSIYFPPRPPAQKQLVPYRKTVKELIAWLGYEPDLLPARTIQLICTDLNDGVGLQQLPGVGWTAIEGDAVGDYANEQGHEATAHMIDFRETQHMCMYNTMRTPSDHGYAFGRRREGAILVSLNVVDRIRRAGLSRGEELMDLTNAFQCTS